MAATVNRRRVVKMSVVDDDGEIEDAGGSQVDFFDHEPTKQEKMEMRKASKRPSEWLKLLCRDWAVENEAVAETTDAKFIDYKPYMKGLLSSQLLCRLSIPSKDSSLEGNSSQSLGFWEILGIADAFDRAYIVAQIERFCALYNIRAVTLEENVLYPLEVPMTDPAALAAAAAAGMAVPSPTGLVALPSYVDPTATAAAAAAAAVSNDMSKLKKGSESAKGPKKIVDMERLENEQRQSKLREQRRLSQERKEQRAKDREAVAVKKASERAAREATREERRRKKVEIRQQREKFAQQQKEAALQRAAELVSSNRVPIEITRGAAAAKAAASAVLATVPTPPPPPPDQSRKKGRSAIVVSTAADLHQIVTHSKNLWAKYNAIAKEHNQKVNWTTVAKELGIHVKVREKYARMHSRAEQRGFDWVANGWWKIKDHPEVFVEPTLAEQKAKMPLPPPDPTRTVLIDGVKDSTDDEIAAAAAVVDASVTTPSEEAAAESKNEQAQAGPAESATLVAAETMRVKMENDHVDESEIICRV